MRTYHIHGLAELFPQHCQVPCLTWTKHLKGLSDKMVTTLSAMTPNKQRPVLKLICSKLAAQGISSETASVHMHPLHKWTLPADNPQCTPTSNAIIPTEQTVVDIPSKQRVADMHGN
jgi:hypothetical protein